MIAEDKLNVEENRKIAIFLNSVGAEAQRQYYTLPKASTVTSLSKAIDLLRQRYVVKSRPWVIRMKFNDRRQLQGETIADYISALRALAKDCAYGSMEDELIRDRFIVGTKIKQLRDRLLVETTDLNLDQVVQLATQYEKAQEDNKMFDNTPEGINKIAANDRRTEPNLRERKKISTNFKCLRCGGKHKATSPDCPAKDVKCHQCLKVGHFKKYCLSKFSVKNITMAQCNQPIHQPSKLEMDLNVNGGTSNVLIKFLVDTGSSVSLIPESLYTKYFENIKLNPASVALKSYTQQAIDVLGDLPAKIKHGNTVVHTLLHVVRADSTILGLELFNKLGLSMKDGKVNQITESSKILETLPFAKDIEYKIFVDTSVPPVQQKLRRLPPVLLDEVHKEIQRLVKMDIIEPIVTSKWISPIVVSKRKDGSIRLCVDLREPNKAAYHQIRLHPDSRYLTAFITHMGIYQFKRLPYGLSSAPGAFQRYLSELLMDIKGWRGEHAKALQTVKDSLKKGQVLALFCPKLPTVITTDASHSGIGCVVSQLSEKGEKRIVACASRTLSDAERKYSIVEKEALACVWACEKFRRWVWGLKFTLRTDQSSLTTLLTTKGNDRAELRIARWSARLMNFDYNIEYKKGRDNVLPDYLSRSSLSSHEDYDGEVELIASINQDMLAISEEEFLRECSLCPEIIALKEQLMKPWIQEDLILNEKGKILVPVSLRNKLLSFAHKAHQGMVRTKQRLRESYWWPGMDKDVEDLVTNCWVCKNHDKRLKSIRVPITPVERPANPWTKLGLDIVGPFIDSDIGFRFAITLIDYTSKWPEVFSTNKTTSKVIINFLEDVFSREGFPREIVTDNGTPFISEEFEDFLRSNGIKHIRTANYHPACNGEVENFNKTLKSTVLTAHLQHTEVKRTIQLFLREYRSTPHTVTKQTPSAVLHGRTLRTLVHVFDKEVKTKPPEEACRQEDKSDSESKSCSPKLQVGDQVKVQAGDPVMKGRSKLRGPFTITKQLRPFTFVLSDGKVWNARRLRLYQKCAGIYTRPDIRHELGIHPALHLDDPASQEESTPPPDSSPIASRLRSKCYRKGGRCDVVTSPDVT
ncbi:hypothetical protein LAZ67_4001712 [Cordylochernes scorpioides]|uniref:RNA-directed DNA polymerase n=1 Tax=Cordylochernes scorpioides TaxID=51811 RepID=A0ABY6KF77_9ARAC|nr:hypothetical protein LAZ67_4001712 [Cordylochernes scorpioides]